MADTIDTPSLEYLERANDWRDCRDVIAGSRTVKRAGERYLPRLDGQSDKQYAAYIKRALFFAATSRTVSGMVGLIFRKPPVIELPTALAAMVETITPDGHTLEDLLEEVVTEVVSVNYIGLLVDHPASDPSVVTAAQAAARGIRPYISLYRAETILSVEFGIVNGLRSPVRVRLQDDARTIRELVLLDGIYNVILHRRTATSSEWVADAPYTPLAQAKPLAFIPFIVASDEPVLRAPPRPLFSDLVDVNISHFQTSADLDHGAHWTALPTPYVSGEELPEELPSLSMGAGSAWVVSGKSVAIGILEYAGTGLGALEKRADAKAAMMVTLGARILASEKSAVESSETHSIKRAGENSVLASLVHTVSRQVEKAVMWMAAWAGIAGTISIQLNDDFIPGDMSPQALAAWVGALQSGAVSQETFFEALVDGEVVNPDLTFDTEQERRQQTAADLPPTTA